MRWLILLLLFGLVGAVAKNGCHVREFYGIGYELNDPKLADLESKINAELKAIGSTGTVASLAPTAKVNGRWKVQPGPRQGGKPEQFTFIFDKDFALDKLTVRCFSPLAGTVFSIVTSCTPAAKPAAPKKA